NVLALSEEAYAAGEIGGIRAQPDPLPVAFVAGRLPRVDRAHHVERRLVSPLCEQRERIEQHVEPLGWDDLADVDDPPRHRPRRAPLGAAVGNGVVDHADLAAVDPVREQLLLDELRVRNVSIDAAVDDAPPEDAIEASRLRGVPQAEDDAEAGAAREPERGRRTEHGVIFGREDVRRTETPDVAQQIEARLADIPEREHALLQARPAAQLVPVVAERPAGAHRIRQVDDLAALPRVHDAVDRGAALAQRAQHLERHALDARHHGHVAERGQYPRMAGVGRLTGSPAGGQP